ncbi:MAG: ATP-binding protein [Kiritimatiellae bacterium]|nr:ATP-binding protein [Kiritimatiellia bacterium]MBR2939576.1 ATP-binding protein [Kiritimatiellia bacterium]
MLKRKISKRLEQFFSDNGRYALLVDGARQVGKTFIIEDFARRHYENFIEINFVKTPSARRIFENVDDESDILEKLSTFSRKGLMRGKTLVFLDEVQECPEAVTYIKFLVQDGTCHYVLSGSLLGVELKNVRSVPVGFMDEVKMYPLDFEEFVLANGEREELIAAARKSWEERRPLDRLYHERLSKLFRLYLVVGGMPAAVQRYLDTHDISAVVQEQEQILVEYRKDITKYDRENSLRIREVFERIAPELNKKNKRFYVNSVKPGERTERLEDEFVWLKEAGVAIPSYVVDEPAVPLVLSKRSNLFKLFMNDVGLLAASYMDGIQLRILNSELDINFGSVYENAVAQELVAHGFLPSYYSSREHGEIDFVLETGGKILPIEVKSGKHYKRHRALNKLMECDEYGIESAIVFDDDAMDVVGKVFYAPIYMVMFLKKDSLPANMIYDIGKPLEL